MRKVKITSLMISAFMITSLISVMAAAPVSAGEPVIEVELQTKGSGTAVWTTEKAYSGSYSVKLTIPATATWADAARVKVPYGELLSTLMNDTIKYWYSYSGTPHNSFVRLDIDADGNGIRDHCLISRKQAATVYDGTWTQTFQEDYWQDYTIDEGAQTGAGTNTWKTMEGWKADTTTFPSLTTMVMDLWVMMGPTVEDQPATESMYIDDISIGGTPYWADPTVPATKLQTKGDGTAEWTTDQVHAGDYSVELVNPAADDWSHGAEVQVPYGQPLSTINSESITYTYYTNDTPNPIPALYLDTTDDGAVNIDLVLAGTVIATQAAGRWVTTFPIDEAHHSWIEHEYDSDTGMAGATESPQVTYGSIAEAISTLPDTTTLVRVGLGYGGPTSKGTLYVDDITIAGVTYDLEPVLEAELQATGDATAKWTTEPVHLGDYSVELFDGNTTVVGDTVTYEEARVVVSYGEALNTLTASLSDDTYKYWVYPMTTTHLSPILYVDTDGDGAADVELSATNIGLAETFDAWQQVAPSSDITNNWAAKRIVDDMWWDVDAYDDPTAGGTPSKYHPLDYWVDVEGTSHGIDQSDIVLYVGAATVGCGGGTFYVDDITIAGVTYDLEPPVINEKTRKRYATIQDAINDASEGDTILIYPGTYSTAIIGEAFPITVNKANLTLTSEGGPEVTVIDAAGATIGESAGIINVPSDNVTIDELTLKNALGVAEAGVQITGANVNVYNCIIAQNYWGIHQNTICAHDLTVKNNMIEDSTDVGLLLYGGTVRNNVFENDATGIMVYGGVSTIVNNTFRDNGWAGIVFYNTPVPDSATVENNNFMNLTYAIVNGVDDWELTAKYNYWGDDSGPSQEIDDVLDAEAAAEGAGEAIWEEIGAIDYNPWLLKPFEESQTYYDNCRVLVSGWNLISTPKILENDDISEMVADTGDLHHVYKYDSVWFADDESAYKQEPLYAVFIEVKDDAGSIGIGFKWTTDVWQTVPPARVLPENWSMIGPSIDVDNENVKVDVALDSVEYAAGGVKGYSTVYSPVYNTSSWAVTQDEVQPSKLYENTVMYPYEGYWIFMEASDTLAGRTT